MLWRLLLSLTLLIAGSLHAQSSDADLQTHLLHQPLYLRGLWSEDKLQFDASGNLIGNSQTLPFTLSGIDIQALKLEGGGLTLTGHRVGLLISKNLFARKKLREGIRIKIEAPTDGDYASALETIFTANIAELVPSLPDYWQAFGKEVLLSAATFPNGSIEIVSEVPAKCKVTHDPDSGVRQVSGSISPPRVLFAPEPEFSPQARTVKKIDGSVCVSLQVDTQGKPNHIRILRPIGLGLDELAVDAVSRYKLRPAEEAGTPVPVEIQLVVHFQTF